jgi:hypothetical protein
VKVLEGHTDWVHSVAFSHDGRFLATGGADGSLRVWDVASGQTTYLERGTQPVWSLSWSPNGSLIGAGLDGSARRWLVTSDGGGVRLQSTQQWTAMGLRSQLPVVRTTKSNEALSLAVEEEALRLVSKLSQATELVDDVVAAIRREPELSDEVRSRAILLAKRRPVDPNRLNNIAWDLVRRAGQSPTDYQRGLLLIAEALRIRPDDMSLRNTLGVAQYRNGQWKEAVDTFEKSLAMGERLPIGPYPHDMAFLAMSHAQLGDLDLAATMLARANEAAKSPRWRNDDELREYLSEARQTIDERTKQ